ncbi:MAG: hydroxymethylbilane synthase [Acidimicrobiia bacterium]|nr:hydroxymethylbilane synthase [Acidimicrobiia bacterium]
MPTEIRLATRRSALALYQAGRVADRLRAVHGDMRIELVEIDSTGDLDRNSPVAQLTQMGAFVRAVQAAVLDGRADAAVHSLKDLPTAQADGLVLAALPERATPWDAVVGARLADLTEGAVVGTGSPRRIAQLKAIRPDLSTRELRGNVDTRLRKVAGGEVDAAILAEAGLTRLGHTDDISEVLTLDSMVPAPGQGVLAVETRDHGPIRGLVAVIDDHELAPLVAGERLLLTETGAGCRSALGALAQWHDGRIRMDAFIEDHNGARRTSVLGDDPAGVVAAARKELGL